MGLTFCQDGKSKQKFYVNYFGKFDIEGFKII